LFQKRLNGLALLSIRPDLNTTTDGFVDELANKRKKLVYHIVYNQCNYIFQREDKDSNLILTLLY
jgi:hypothetical protein